MHKLEDRRTNGRAGGVASDNHGLIVALAVCFRFSLHIQIMNGGENLKLDL